MLKKLWNAWMRFGLVLGNFISSVFLFVFYFSVFALFALPYRLLTRFGGLQNDDSNYAYPGKQMEGLDDFKKEF